MMASSLVALLMLLPLSSALSMLNARACTTRMSATSTMLMLPVVNDASFASTVLARSRPVLIDFYADWCGPCKLLEPELRKLQAKGVVDVVKARLEKNPKIKRWLRAEGIKLSMLPSCVLVSEGKARDIITGVAALPKLEEFIRGAVVGSVKPTNAAPAESSLLDQAQSLLDKRFS